jgi:hypothetical protein
MKPPMNGALLRARQLFRKLAAFEMAEWAVPAPVGDGYARSRSSEGVNPDRVGFGPQWRHFGKGEDYFGQFRSALQGLRTNGVLGAGTGVLLGGTERGRELLLSP